MVKAAQYIFVATLLALLFVYVARFPNHFPDTEWPAHAKSHLFSQISVGAGFTILALIVSIRSFRDRQPWVWWVLLGFGIFNFGGYWIGKIVWDVEASWRSGNTVFLVLSICYLLGLSLSWQFFKGGNKIGK
jgi:hypothetical protein